MPPLESLATFAVGLAVLGLSPGPDFMLLLARGIGQGHKVALMTVVGIFTMGGVALAAGSLGAWLARRPKFLVWQKRFSGMVMIGLGIRLLFSARMTASWAALRSSVARAPTTSATRRPSRTSVPPRSVAPVRSSAIHPNRIRQG
jgi:threonine/homoserine/homoserine lactone efflux protein